MSASYRHAWRAIAVLLLLSPGVRGDSTAQAQEAASPTFAIIDYKRILRTATAVDSFNRQFEGRREKYRDQLRKLEQELRDADQELARQRSILSADAYVEKRRQLQEQFTARQLEARQRRRSLDQRYADGMSQVRSELVKIAGEIARERDLDLIISKSAVIILKPKFDLTDEVLKRLNARLPEITALAPEN